MTPATAAPGGKRLPGKADTQKTGIVFLIPVFSLNTQYSRAKCSGLGLYFTPETNPTAANSVAMEEPP